MELLLLGGSGGGGIGGVEGAKGEVEVTEDLAEWGYGDYEGLVTGEIREGEEGEEGLGRGKGGWDIWRDGC